jgi:hypothetical protein
VPTLVAALILSPVEVVAHLSTFTPTRSFAIARSVATQRRPPSRRHRPTSAAPSTTCRATSGLRHVGAPFCCCRTPLLPLHGWLLLPPKLSGRCLLACRCSWLSMLYCSVGRASHWALSQSPPRQGSSPKQPRCCPLSCCACQEVEPLHPPQVVWHHCGARRPDRRPHRPTVCAAAAVPLRQAIADRHCRRLPFSGEPLSSSSPQIFAPPHRHAPQRLPHPDPASGSSEIGRRRRPVAMELCSSASKLGQPDLGPW